MNTLAFPVESAVGSFLLSFPALFSVVNPIGSALIFGEMTADRPPVERRAIARRVAIYSVSILLASLWLGSDVLSFFGISIGALRIAGGLVVAFTAWGLLLQPDLPTRDDAGPVAPAGKAERDVAFFPLTMPITTGPGTIAVAIALASQRPTTGEGLVAFFSGLTAAALAIATIVWVCDRSSDRLTRLLGTHGVAIVSRLVAFLLLCIGVQIMVTGVMEITAMMGRTT